VGVKPEPAVSNPEKTWLLPKEEAREPKDLPERTDSDEKDDT
jgi:hypothetical protein